MTTTKPYYQTSISYEVKEEWMMKEYGSWEDHSCPETGHVYPLLWAMPDTKIICKTKEEAAIIQMSANYQTSWDSDESIVKRLMRKAAKIAKEISLLNNS